MGAWHTYYGNRSLLPFYTIACLSVTHLPNPLVRGACSNRLETLPRKAAEGSVEAGYDRL